MNARFRSLLALALLGATPVFAGKPATPSPSVRLRTLVDKTMVQLGAISDPHQPAFNRTALSTAQADFTAKAITAPPAEQPMYQAAQKVVTNLVGAIEEHEKAVADYRYSNSVHGKQDRENAVISNPQHGRDAGAVARADNAKQKTENADTRKALLDKEKFMNEGAVAAWTDRLGQLHSAIEESVVAEMVAEKQYAMIAPPALPPPPAPKPKETREISAAEQYSPVGEWKAATHGHRPATLKEDYTVIGGKTTGTWKWTDQSKGALNITWSDGLKMDVVFSSDGRALTGLASNGNDANFTRSTATTPAASESKPAPKPNAPTVSEQNSAVGEWKATVGAHRPVTILDDNTANIGVPGKKLGGTWKWTDKSKGALHVAWSDGRTMDLNVSADGRTLSGTESNGQVENYTRSTGAAPTASTASEQNSAVGDWQAVEPHHRSATFHDDNTVTGGHDGRKFTGVWSWTDQSKGTVNLTWSDGLTVDLNISADGRTMSGKASNGGTDSYTRSTGAAPDASTAAAAPPAVAEIRLNADLTKGLSIHRDKAVALSLSAVSKIRIQPGLKDPSLVSLQLAGTKGFYLRHSYGILYLHERPEANALFDADASFKLVHLDGDKVRFESSNFPGTFITAKEDGSVVVIRECTAAQSTFILKAQ